MASWHHRQQDCTRDPMSMSDLRAYTFISVQNVLQCPAVDDVGNGVVDDVLS
jgi:hypothetical protein